VRSLHDLVAGVNQELAVDVPAVLDVVHQQHDGTSSGALARRILGDDRGARAARPDAAPDRLLHARLPRRSWSQRTAGFGRRGSPRAPFSPACLTPGRFVIQWPWSLPTYSVMNDTPVRSIAALADESRAAASARRRATRFDRWILARMRERLHGIP